jgi:hypothetical protein
MISRTRSAASFAASNARSETSKSSSKSILTDKDEALQRDQAAQEKADIEAEDKTMEMEVREEGSDAGEEMEGVREERRRER